MGLPSTVRRGGSPVWVSLGERLDPLVVDDIR
jgi:hypothetical protein